MILVFVSAESRKDGLKLANYLIDNHIAACVSILPVESFYFWKGKKVRSHEFELMIKTQEDKFKDLEQAISEILPYEIPQIIGISAEGVNDSYLKWLKEAVL